MRRAIPVQSSARMVPTNCVATLSGGKGGVCPRAGAAMAQQSAETSVSLWCMGINLEEGYALAPNAPPLSCAARAGGRDDLKCGAWPYVGAQIEFCQGRAAASSTASWAPAKIGIGAVCTLF